MARYECDCCGHTVETESIIEGDVCPKCGSGTMINFDTDNMIDEMNDIEEEEDWQLKMKLIDTYFQITHPLSVALAAAQRRGVLLDIKARDALRDAINLRAEATIRRIEELAGKKINPNSPKQVSELLYRDMKFPVVYNDDKPTTDEDAILRLHRKYPSEEILSAIVSYRKDTKLVSTFLSDGIVDSDGRVHTSYNPSGTKNYRISSSKNIWGSGMNLQNIPVGKRAGVENIRHLFIAADGNSFVKCDLVQAETMAVARILCRYKDYTLYEKYRSGNFDIHKWAAAPIYGIKEDAVTKEQRDIGKVANHAGNYCSGPRVIMAEALKRGIDNIDFEMAKIIVATRRATIPGLTKWWSDVEATIRRTRSLETCIGRKRMFFGRFDDNAVIRDAVAFEPQSTVGDVCNIIFTRLYNSLERPALPILQVHDEVVVECPDSYIDTVVRKMKEASIIPLCLNGSELPMLVIPIEISVGKNWRDMTVVSK